uniref:Uncharacterized protein n=1 Tax=Anguilla anguilla TaxID=7936 RepID=A0A0E9PHE8_ANGAN
MLQRRQKRGSLVCEKSKFENLDLNLMILSFRE